MQNHLKEILSALAAAKVEFLTKSQEKRIDQKHRKWAKRIAQFKPEDFDGHTEFYRLTPEQRLDWLAQAVCFVAEFKGRVGSGRK